MADAVSILLVQGANMNFEGVAVDRIYAAAEAGCHGLLMNPAGFLLGGHALADCLRAVRLPYVEVHMTNIERRGRTSVMAETADGMVAGLGPPSSATKRMVPSSSSPATAPAR